MTECRVWGEHILGAHMQSSLGLPWRSDIEAIGLVSNLVFHFKKAYIPEGPIIICAHQPPLLEKLHYLQTCFQGQQVPSFLSHDPIPPVPSWLSQEWTLMQPTQRTIISDLKQRWKKIFFFFLKNLNGRNKETVGGLRQKWDLERPKDHAFAKVLSGQGE